jgi:hypothetical protein
MHPAAKRENGAPRQGASPQRASSTQPLLPWLGWRTCNEVPKNSGQGSTIGTASERTRLAKAGLKQVLRQLRRLACPRLCNNHKDLVLEHLFDELVLERERRKRATLLLNAFALGELSRFGSSALLRLLVLTAEFVPPCLHFVPMLVAWHDRDVLDPRVSDSVRVAVVARRGGCMFCSRCCYLVHAGGKWPNTQGTPSSCGPTPPRCNDHEIEFQQSSSVGETLPDIPSPVRDQYSNCLQGEHHLLLSFSRFPLIVSITTKSM